MPAQRPGSSVQEVATPPEFLDAVVAKFGPIVWDLAADASNHVVPGWFGPGSEFGEDSLAQSWSLNNLGLLWLNPPYDSIRKFAEKCRAEAARGAKIAMLIPASVATNWFADLIHGVALVMPIRPRLMFVGHSAPYPKDLMLCCYNCGEPRFEPWRWGC